MVVPEKISMDQEFFLGRGQRHQHNVVNRDPYRSVFGAYFSSEWTGQYLHMAPTRNFDYGDSFAFEFWLWIAENTPDQYLIPLDISYKYYRDHRFSILIAPWSGRIETRGFCVSYFSDVVVRKNWNLIVVEKNANTNTISARIAHRNGFEEQSYSCTADFTDHIDTYPREHYNIMIGAYSQGYENNHGYSFQGYLRHVKYYKGAFLYFDNQIG